MTLSFLAAFCAALLGGACLADDLAKAFREPPESSRPGVYWYFMDGNLSREGMTRDLESMKAAGMGHVLFLEVNVGVPRGSVNFLSDEWQNLFAHAVREAERLGMQLILGSGPGWTGSGGPWVKAEQSMQHLVASKTEVNGPTHFTGKLPVAPPRRPFFGDVPGRMRAEWESFYRDVAVLAFPAPAVAAEIQDIDEKALVYRAPFSSQPGVRARIEAPAKFDEKPGTAIERERIIDLTARMKPDGSLDWDAPAGKWVIMRFVSRNNGASTRPAPEPGIGFECDKFDRKALDAHFDEYVGKLLRKVGDRQPGKGWTTLHIDSWEMGAQNWTANMREEFRKRRGYDPLPFYPAFAGRIVDSREMTERFLWDLRLTGQELVIENHAEHLKRLGRKHGFDLSIEPYDMNPANDFDLGAVADIPMCEFWSLGFETSFSCHEATSIAHIMGRPIVGAEAFTADAPEAWRFHPGSLKNQGDWAFATGVNRFTYHTFAHKPDEGRPGMVMGPYGVHWDRGQTWWPMVGSYHRYISRCSHVLRQGRTEADILYLLPEGAPNVFQPPPSALTGTTKLPDRRGFNFDGCSAQILMEQARVKSGRVVFPSGADYEVLVLPASDTMTPKLVEKIASLVRSGATVIGDPPVSSPSLVGYPACDAEVAKVAREVWGSAKPQGRAVRQYGKGRIYWGEKLSGPPPRQGAIAQAKWIWLPEGNPAASAPVGSARFERQFVVQNLKQIVSATLEMTADNSFVARLNDKEVLTGNNFTLVGEAEILKSLKAGTNILTVEAANSGETPNPAGLIGALEMRTSSGETMTLLTDESWVTGKADSGLTAAKVLGGHGMGPWNLAPRAPQAALYPAYEEAAKVLREKGLIEDFASDGPVRYTHRQTKDHDIYFLANTSDSAVETRGIFRMAGRSPELWDPATGEIRALPEFAHRENVTEVPLRFEPYESYFIVFPEEGKGRSVGGRNFKTPAPVRTIEGPWQVSFDSSMGAPSTAVFEKLEDWSKHSDNGIRHYSGIATYKSEFTVTSEEAASGAPLILDLGAVQVMARVRVNGRDCGVVWTAPWSVPLKGAVKPGTNSLEIEVANLWPNRMIGDAGAAKPFTQTTYRPYKAGDALLPSGLLGPVQLMK